MRALLPLCLVLTCCVLSGSCTDLSCSDSCCANSSCSQSCRSCVVPGNCRNPLLQLLQEDLLYTSPYYEHVSMLNSRSLKIDSCCLTYFLITTGTNVLLAVRSCVFKNSTGFIDYYISGPVPGCPSVTRLQGVKGFDVIEGCETCVYNSYILGEICEGTYVLYRCYHQGDCDGLDANQEIRLGVSVYRDLSDCCKDRIIALANQQSDIFYLSRDFIKYPGKLNRRCVKYFNGAPCINAYKIDPRDVISVPGEVPCSQDEHTEL